MNDISIILRCAPALLLAGCGGGSFYLALGDDFSDPPRVELAAAETVVQPLQTVRLVAAAADDSGFVDRVLFFRFDGEQIVRIALDGVPPYEANMVVPNDGRNFVSVFARAVDGDGEEGDSNLVTLEIRT